MRIIITIWLSVIGTFGLTSAYVLSREKSIGAPGELGETFSSVGIITLALLLGLTAITIATLSAKSRSTHK